jgi:hypothetical protein
MRQVDLTSADYTSPSQLASSSEYVVTVSIIDAPKPYVLAAAPILRYWVSNARITSVVAQRPDVVNRLSVGMTIPIGTQLLNATQENSVVNYADLAKTFPTESDIPVAGDNIVAFLVHGDLGAFGSGYQAVGQARVGQLPGAVTLRALPGSLNHRVLNIKDVTTSVLGELRGPAPWRVTRGGLSSSPTRLTPPESGPPASSKAPAN